MAASVCLGGEYCDPVRCLCIFKSDGDAGLILFASKLTDAQARASVQMLVRGVGEALSALRPDVHAGCGSSSAAATLLGRPRRRRSDNPVEVGLRSRIAMDWHVLGHIKLQALNVPEQRNGIRADTREIPARCRRAV
jgi:hypothetical protein